ncbi:MAG: glycosyltransferase family 2 protein [Actinobacteria bacterium]|nr:glycosyltransferase family 2 protein [Actinomycetota bacterium]
MASDFVIFFNLLVLFYFAALNTIYIVLFTAALVESRHYVHRKKIVDLSEVFRSPLTPSISMLIPAYNEDTSIAEVVKAVLMLHYPRFEVVVINDGSTDLTLDVLKQRYKLERIAKVVRSTVPCELIRGVYISREYENLIVVDKENGGKADALNAGINVSRHELMCVIDADSLIEPEGLLKVARPFIEDPTRTVATGGLVRIVNGCTIEKGNIAEVKLPGSILANLQIVEYLRAFLGGRMGWSALRSLLIISGAFGLFKREEVIEIGGYKKETVGEDMDLVVRLHRHLREKKQEYRMYFVPDPVCWTEAPEKYVQLSRQRDRWQRGLIESLGSNLRMLMNPRYGPIGLFAMPYFFFFEMVGPAVELLGYIAVVLAIIFGLINYQFFILFIAVAFLYSIAISLFAVYLEGVAFQRYARIGSLLRLAFFAILENLGYRQINSWWRSKAYFTYFTRRRKWGEIDHEGYGEPGEFPLEVLAVEPDTPIAMTPTIMAPAVAEAGQEKGKGRAPGARPRFAWLIVVVLAATAIVLPLSIYRNRGGGVFPYGAPTSIKVEDSNIYTRAKGQYFEVHTGDGWKKLLIKGVNVGSAVPGKWFSEFPENEELYLDWFEKIAGMNANTIRVYTLFDPTFYRALDKFNGSSERKLLLLQEIWPDDEVPDYNLYNEEFVKQYREEIKRDIRALSGDADIPQRKGRAFGNYDTDVSRYILGLIIGREIITEEARETNSLNPDRSGYSGTFISAVPGSNAVETWIAESCDYAVEQMSDNGWMAPVSFVSWPTLDTMVHPTENTPGLPKEKQSEDSMVFDPNRIEAESKTAAGLFGCYHIYPHYPDFIYREPAYAQYTDPEGVLRYGGYLKQFMDIHPDYPALIGEFGISTSLGVAHLNPDGFSHGGVSEQEQGKLVSRLYGAILDEGYAGGLVFEWADEWAKRTWIYADYMIPYDRHVYWHNIMDPEQNYGIMAYNSTNTPFGKKESYYRVPIEGPGTDSENIGQILVDHDEAFLYLKIGLAGAMGNELKPGTNSGLHLEIGIDTLGDANGTHALPVIGLPPLPTGVEFMLSIDGQSGGLLLARPDYNRGTTKFMAAPSNDPAFVPIQFLVNREQYSSETGEIFPGEYTNDSILFYGNFEPGTPEYNSLSHWFIGDSGNYVYVRLPWLLLNVSDPSSLTILYDERTDLPEGPDAVRTYMEPNSLGTTKTEGFLFYAALTRNGGLIDFQPKSGDAFSSDTKRFKWKGWNEPTYRERLKDSYAEITDLFKETE